MVYKGSDIIATEEAVDDAAVEKLAADFANKVPEGEFSPWACEGDARPRAIPWRGFLY